MYIFYASEAAGLSLCENCAIFFSQLTSIDSVGVKLCPSPLPYAVSFNTMLHYRLPAMELVCSVAVNITL